MIYRLLTGEDDSAFCHKVTQALAEGWELSGSPAYAHDPWSGKMRCAQAVIKRDHASYHEGAKLREL